MLIKAVVIFSCSTAHLLHVGLPSETENFAVQGGRDRQLYMFVLVFNCIHINSDPTSAERP